MDIRFLEYFGTKIMSWFTKTIEFKLLIWTDLWSATQIEKTLVNIVAKRTTIIRLLLRWWIYKLLESSFTLIARTTRSSRSVTWSWVQDTVRTNTMRSSAADPVPRPASFLPEGLTWTHREGGEGTFWRISSKKVSFASCKPDEQSRAITIRSLLHSSINIVNKIWQVTSFQY